MNDFGWLVIGVLVVLAAVGLALRFVGPRVAAPPDIVDDVFKHLKQKVYFDRSTGLVSFGHWIVDIRICEALAPSPDALAEWSTVINERLKSYGTRLQHGRECAIAFTWRFGDIVPVGCASGANLEICVRRATATDRVAAPTGHGTGGIRIGLLVKSSLVRWTNRQDVGAPEFRLGYSVRIGRGEDNDLYDTDREDLLSDPHCQLRARSEGVETVLDVTDLGSKNGTWVWRAAFAQSDVASRLQASMDGRPIVRLQPNETVSLPLTQEKRVVIALQASTRVRLEVSLSQSVR